MSNTWTFLSCPCCQETHRGALPAEWDTGHRILPPKLITCLWCSCIPGTIPHHPALHGPWQPSGYPSEEGQWYKSMWIIAENLNLV